MKKRLIITAVLTMVLATALATTAQAFPSKTSACSGCHTQSTTVKVTAVQTANDGVKATYSVTVTGPNPIMGWTVLDGSTNVANATAATGTFQVAVGKTYTVWGVSKNASMPYSNSITISPVAPVTAPPAPTPEPTATPLPTPEPTATPVAVSTVSLRMHFGHAKRAVVKLTNVETGEVILGTMTRAHNKVTFKNVADGTYVLTVKYKHHKTKKIGTYVVAAGKITKLVPVNTDQDDSHDQNDD